MEAIHVFLFCITLILFFIRPKFLRKSNTKNLPPGPNGLPIIGNLHQLGPRPHETLSAMAKEFGPLMTLKFGSVTTIVASSAETTKEILHTHDQTFSNRPVPDSVATQPHPEGTLAWVPGDHRWRNRRRICSTQMFTSQRLDLLQHFRHKKVHQLIAHINKYKGTPVDIGSLAFATTLNLISNTIFSVDIVDPDFESAQEFKELVWRIMMDAGKPNVSDYFPMLKRFDLQGVRRHVQVSYKRMHEIFDDIIAERLKHRETDKTTRHGDFLDVLLDQMQEDGSDFSIETIKPLILDLFIAGSDTSGLTTEWAMAELLQHVNCYKSVWSENRRNCYSSVGTSGDKSNVSHPEYLLEIVRQRWNRIGEILGQRNARKFTWNLKVQIQALKNPAVSVQNFGSDLAVKNMGVELIDNSFLMLSPVNVKDGIDVCIVAWILWPDEERNFNPNLEKVLIGCDGANSVVADFLGLKPLEFLSLSQVRGYTEYPSGYDFRNEYVQFTGDHSLIARIPIDNKLVYWFMTMEANPKGTLLT
ncbi:hypothetical protein CMV_010606 [Castanea mollissima]|uniref:Cytochrome P450 n=1 Tax=Castanea mollissima TaxID=60419 RepID=A0A8J4RIU6_9ROSI|nr:hypothetical protein CMV_010606 [Castanea mollissima]